MWLSHASVYGFSEASPDVSFMGMADLQQRAAAAIQKDRAVATVGSAIGGGNYGLNTGRMFISLKPEGERDPIGKVIQRLRGERAKVPGITTYLQPVVGIRIGGRLTRTQHRFTLQDIARTSSLSIQPLLIAAAIFAVYVVLGVLYESFSTRS